MRIALTSLALAALLGAPAHAGEASPAAEAAAGPGACAEAAIAAVQQRYEAVRDLEARFEQQTRSVTLGPGGPGPTSESRGRVWFAKPGKMRWVYEEPASVVVSDGRTLWLYDPEHAEAQRLPVGEGYLSGAAIQFLLGEGDVTRAFHVMALACDEDSAELELLPRDPATYERLRVVVDRRTGDLRRTTVVDLLGNVTEVTFHDVRVNQDPADDVFGFEVPEGVRVIDLLETGGSGEAR